MDSHGHDRSERPDGNRPARAVAGALGLIAAFVACAALAGDTLYLSKDRPICDVKQIVCVSGTLGYDVNSRLLWLRGRVQFTTIPGMLQITVKGSNQLGHVYYAPMEIKLRGRASEIVDFKMVPDEPDVYAWAIDHIVFLPSKDQ